MSETPLRWKMRDDTHRHVGADGGAVPAPAPALAPPRATLRPRAGQLPPAPVCRREKYFRC